MFKRTDRPIPFTFAFRDRFAKRDSDFFPCHASVTLFLRVCMKYLLIFFVLFFGTN